jgi:DNA-directed RNA polymerase specialized sigma24 family protein
VDELDRRGAALLSELASNPTSDCWRQFDSLFYEIVWRFLRLNHKGLGIRVARYLGMQGRVAPEILAEEVDEVAHEATKIALRRVRQNAVRFDLGRGKPTRWVIGAAEYAYVEVAKAIAEARRSDRLVFVPPETLLEEADTGPTPEERALQTLQDAEALQEAARHLTEKEFAALRLVVTLGYSYSEAAKAIFGDASMTKQVDGLLTRGKRKLAAAWRDRGLESGRSQVVKYRPSLTDREEGDE